jgi:predicted GIY-YIG superfamily endonuclease
MPEYYVFIICSPDNKNLFVANGTEVLDFLDKYQNQAGKQQDFPHANDKLVYFEKFGSAEEAERRKHQIILADDKEKRRMIGKFNPRWETLLVRFAQEKNNHAQS